MTISIYIYSGASEPLGEGAVAVEDYNVVGNVDNDGFDCNGGHSGSFC